MRKYFKYILIFPFILGFVATTLAHGFLQTLAPEEMRRLQQEMIDGKFLNPKDVVELGMFDTSTDNAFDRYIICLDDLKNKNCDELKYDYKGIISTSTQSALEGLKTVKWWDQKIEWIAGGISLSFGAVAYLIDLKNKKTKL